MVSDPTQPTQPHLVLVQPNRAELIPKFSLRFNISQIPVLTEKYVNSKEYTTTSEMYIERKIAPRTQRTGYFTLEDFLVVCKLKSPRSFKQCKLNSPEFIKVVTHAALSSSHEQFRIECLTLLRGVSWPTASVLLHFGSMDPYLILDFRALWSLQIPVPKRYDFTFWWSYTEYCRKLANRAGVSMRTLGFVAIQQR